jgi:hypothetical protein
MGLALAGHSHSTSSILGQEGKDLSDDSREAWIRRQQIQKGNKIGDIPLELKPKLFRVLRGRKSEWLGSTPVGIP